MSLLYRGRSLTRLRHGAGRPPSAAMALDIYAKKMARSRDAGQRMDALIQAADSAQKGGNGSGATGLEPATSGVTERLEGYSRSRLSSSKRFWFSGNSPVGLIRAIYRVAANPQRLPNAYRLAPMCRASGGLSCYRLGSAQSSQPAEGATMDSTRKLRSWVAAAFWLATAVAIFGERPRWPRRPDGARPCGQLSRLKGLFPSAKNIGFRVRRQIRPQGARAPIWPGRCGAFWTTYEGNRASIDVSVTLYATPQCPGCPCRTRLRCGSGFGNGARVRTNGPAARA